MATKPPLKKSSGFYGIQDRVDSLIAARRLGKVDRSSTSKGQNFALKPLSPIEFTKKRVCTTSDVGDSFGLRLGNLFRHIVSKFIVDVEGFEPPSPKAGGLQPLELVVPDL